MESFLGDPASVPARLMKTTFLHTADWQLGKPFAGVSDEHNRSLLRQERIAVLRRLRDLAAERKAEFVVVAGDLFDSPSVTQATVSAACAAIGAMGVPVFAIPGNHDHGGPGGLWEKPFFRREREQLAPNLRLLLTPEPVELDAAVIFPCPLVRRHEAADTTAWLRELDFGRFGDKARVVLAHGSTQAFAAQDDDDPAEGAGVNRIDLSRLPISDIDYIALGDWHGLKQVGPKAWYAGTPETDRFPRGPDNQPGHALIVTAGRGAEPRVDPVRTAQFGWHELAFGFTDDAALARLKTEIDTRIGNRTQRDLLRLELNGQLGIEATGELERMIEAWRARLLRLKLDNRTAIAPSPEEIDALTQGNDDPLISRVAKHLVAKAAGEGAEAVLARIALRELHAACNEP
jgi:DNA repair exonuclease SbcCD nuclease subunit